VFLFLACVTPADDTGPTTAATDGPIVVEYSCDDGTTYTFPDAPPLSAMQFVGRVGDGLAMWEALPLDVWPGYEWSANNPDDSQCIDRNGMSAVKGRLVMEFE